MNEMTSRICFVTTDPKYTMECYPIYTKDFFPTISKDREIDTTVGSRNIRIAEAPEMQLSFSPEEQRDVAWDANRRGNTLIMSLATSADWG